MRNKIKLSEINALLIFVGFGLFSSLTYSQATEETEWGSSGDNPLSILYRIFALVISTICIFKYRKTFHFKTLTNTLKIYLFIIFLMSCKLLYSFYLAPDHIIWPKNTKFLYLTFLIGIQIIPTISLITSFSTIRWKYVLPILLIILCYMCFNTLIKTWGAEGRISLNSHQSTLSFAAYSVYLLILSICLTKKYKSNITKLFLVLIIILALISALRAGSRGPVISGVVAILFVLIAKKNFAILTLLITLIYLICGDQILSILENIAPTFFERMNNTIEYGDTSDRDITFNFAISQIISNPIFGSHPLVSIPHGFGSGPHNLILQIGMGLGLFGIFISIILYAKLIAIALKKKNIDYISNFFSGLIIYFIIRSMTGVNIYTASDLSFAIVCLCLYNYKTTNYDYFKAKNCRFNIC